MTESEPTFIDLFAGIGGTRIAFESAGFRCVFSSEWDKYSQQTYEANFGELPHGDISEIPASEIPDFDVLVAGFPCQPFSSIGQRKGFEHKTQGTLFFDIARIIGEKKPSAVLLENVKGLTHHDGGKTWKVIRETLEEMGYTVCAKVLNSKYFDVPQSRERIYIVAFKDAKIATQFNFPNGSERTIGIGKFVETGINDRPISAHLQKSYIFKVDDGRPEIINTETDTPVKTLVASYHKIQRLTGTFVMDKQAGLRLLSEAECKAIMGFPKDFIVPVSRTQMYRQFGNSIAIPVVTRIAQAMKSALGANQ